MKIEMQAKVPVRYITVDTELQVRKTSNEEMLEELKNSLNAVGMLEPLLVKKVKGGRYKVILGSRRVYAARRKNMATVPAMVVDDMSDKDALILMLNENKHREELSPFEEAMGIMKLIDVYGLSLKEVATALGSNDEYIRKRIKLGSVSPKIQALAADRKLNVVHVDTLATLSREDQEKVAQDIQDNILSEEETAVLVRREFQHQKKERLSRKIQFTPKKFALRVATITSFFKRYMPQVVNFQSGRDEIKKELAELKKIIQAVEKQLEKVGRDSNEKKA
ncbi:MAG: ParB/RepB/Spo0J family partition protein [Candidatus Niyogibacteria bacterium]|nr:ParB/RepB/Spo0J family partition protein [Candidatus Niyogibacteria bacterium]